MGKKTREKRRQERKTYAQKRAKEKFKHKIIVIAAIGIVSTIIGYSAYSFTQLQSTAPDAPPGVGPLGSEHSHAGLMVTVFGDPIKFNLPTFQIKNRFIHFEGGEGFTLHKHASGTPLGLLFESVGMKVTEDCIVLEDKREFCNNEDYSLKFYVNGDSIESVNDYVPSDDDKILVSFGGETLEEIASQLSRLDNIQLNK